MNDDPFALGVKAFFIVGLIISCFVYFSDGDMNKYQGTDALFMACGVGFGITFYLGMFILIVWVLASLFK